MPGSYVAMAGQEDLLNIGEKEAELIGESSPVNPMPEENAIPQFIGVNQLSNARGRIFLFQPTNNLFPPRQLPLLQRDIHSLRRGRRESSSKFPIHHSNRLNELYRMALSLIRLEIPCHSRPLPSFLPYVYVIIFISKIWYILDVNNVYTKLDFSMY